MKMDISQIPAGLTALPQWVVWKSIINDKGKPTKVLFNPKTGRRASTTDPSTWATFDDTVKTHEVSTQWDGIGFVFSENDPFAGVDLDGVFDPDTKSFLPWPEKFRQTCANPNELPDPADIVAMLGSYAEISPSGRGVKIFTRGKLPAGGNKQGNKVKGIEMYDHARYFTVTGARLPDSTSQISDCNGNLSELHQAVFGIAGKRKKSPVKPQTSVACCKGDDEIIEIASCAKNGERFQKLWKGDHQDYPSPSEADLALANYLAYHCESDSAIIERLMWQSGLKRKKWSEHPTYLATTIEKAIAGLQKTAQPALTDSGNAERFALRHGANVRFCHPWKKWLIWDNTRWRVDDTGRVERLAKETARSIFAEAAAEIDNDKRKAIAKWARESESAKRRDAMLKLAKSELPIPILPENLDTDPWLLNCENGTLDLRTGMLCQHRQGAFITKLAPVRFDPQAKAPMWEKFHDVIFNSDADLIGFVQRFAGYALTGVVKDQVLPIGHGVGSNGKSTLLNMLLEVLGPDYAMKAAPDLLMNRKNDPHPTELADLFGKRLVCAIESEARHRLNESLVKELTGNDRIRARRMREDFWEFSPTHKLILATNERPEIHGTGHAIWRRVKLIPFDVVVPDDAQDHDLPEKLRAEAPGILAWCLQGCREWQISGLGSPPKVVLETAKYKNEEDILGLFLEQHCTINPEHRIQASKLYARYKSFCTDTGEYVVSQRRFGQRIAERGFERIQSNGIWYKGLGVGTE